MKYIKAFFITFGIVCGVFGIIVLFSILNMLFPIITGSIVMGAAIIAFCYLVYDLVLTYLENNQTK